MSDMRPVPKNHTHLLNDMPLDERKRLSPYLMESQILHLEQARGALIAGHKKTLTDIDEWIANLKNGLRDMTCKNGGLRCSTPKVCDKVALCLHSSVCEKPQNPAETHNQSDKT